MEQKILATNLEQYFNQLQIILLLPTPINVLANFHTKWTCRINASQMFLKCPGDLWIPYETQPIQLTARKMQDAIALAAAGFVQI